MWLSILGFCLQWSVLAATPELGVPQEFLQSELQAGLQLTHTLSSRLLQEESESRFISPEPHLSFSQI